MTKKVKRKSNFANNSFDFILCITVLLLLGLGLIMVLSASSPSALAETGDDSYVYFRKQGIFAIIGLIAMLFISKIDYRFYKKFYKVAYWGSIILLLLSNNTHFSVVEPISIPKLYIFIDLFNYFI